MNTISTKQFILLCNEYTTVNSAGFFVNYLHTNGYIETISPEYSFSKNVPTKDGDVVLTIEDIKSKKEKVKQIVEFVANHSDLIVDNGTYTKEKFLQDLTLLLAKENTSVALDNATRTTLANNFKLYDENMEVPKSHPKRSFLFKKVLKPAAITAAVVGTIAGILSTKSIAANSGYFSPNATLATFSWITTGAAIGAVGAVAASLTISKLTKSYYKRFCQKGNNLEMLEAAKIESIAELNRSTTVLPIKKLMTKLYKTNQKIIANSHKGWWSRTISNYFQKKWHRNQLWALASYTQYLRDISKDLSVTEMQACKVLLEYIDNNLSSDMRDNFAGYSTSYKKLENADIYATIAMGRDKKDSLDAIKNKCHELVKRLTLDHYSNSADCEMFGLVKSISNDKALTDVTIAEVANQTENVDNAEEQVVVEQKSTQTDTQSIKNTTTVNTNSVSDSTETNNTTKIDSSTESIIPTAEQLSIFDIQPEVSQARKKRNENVKATKYKRFFKVIYTDESNNKREVKVRRTNDEDLDKITLSATIANIINNTNTSANVDTTEESDMVVDL